MLLLVDLFRIHQRHWDQLRKRELPSLDLVRADIAKLTESTHGHFRLNRQRCLKPCESCPRHIWRRVTRTAAFFAALASLLAGYLIGRAWP